ncbi:MAG: tetratricopeptide repeat protein [Candidatus Melainabacteria bacterium]|nr:tetratricopeptide repeat protein [Candidatus Melainabacteria bacterium]
MSRKIASHYVLGLCGLMLLWSSQEAQALPKLPFFGKKKEAPLPPKMPEHMDSEEDQEPKAPGLQKSIKPESMQHHEASDKEERGDSDATEKPPSRELNEGTDGLSTSEEEQHVDSEERSRRLPGEKTDRSVLEDNRELELPEQRKADSSVDPRRHYLLAKDLLQQKQYKACLTEVNKALALNPHYWDAMYVGCLSLQMQERNEEAIRKYRKLVKYKPDMTEAHVNLGVLLKKTGELDEAESEYRKAIEINFYKVDPHYNLANLLIEKGDLEGALGELKACVKLSPRNAWVHNNLGVIYQKRNYLEEAEEQFKKALKLEPANRTFEQNLKSVQGQLKKKDVGA